MEKNTAAIWVPGENHSAHSLPEVRSFAALRVTHGCHSEERSDEESNT